MKQAVLSAAPFHEMGGGSSHGQARFVAGEKAVNERTGTRAKRGVGKPILQSLHWTPTLAQRGRWEAVQEAKRQGLSLRAIARKLGMSRATATQYARAESPPTRRYSVKERTKAEALVVSMIAKDWPR